MDEKLFESFKSWYPRICMSAVECYQTGDYEILVKSDNGTVFLYNDIDNTIRSLPKDSNGLTEEECRREFGIRLRRMMDRKFITQMELSEKTGIPQYLISNYINGKTTPSFYKVDKIAKALNCSVDVFRYI